MINGKQLDTDKRISGNVKLGRKDFFAIKRQPVIMEMGLWLGLPFDGNE
jgi:hypothetical protein